MRLPKKWRIPGAGWPMLPAGGGAADAAIAGAPLPPLSSREREAADSSASTAWAAGTSSSSFTRGFAAFLAARAVVGLLLLGSEVVKHAGTDGKPDWVLAVCLLYAAFTTVTWLLPRLQGRALESHQLRRGQWLCTIGLDLLTFGALHLWGFRSGMSFVPLLVLPVLMAGVMTARLAALAVAAAVSLLLLFQSWMQVLAGGEALLLITQSGLVGGGFFVIALLASELAARLAREEVAARGSREAARQQAQLNRLVIEEMQDGVLVADRQGRVRVTNPAALRLLQPEGESRPAPVHLKTSAAWLPLSEAVQQAFSEEAPWPEAGREVSLQFGGGRARSLWVRMRFTRHPASHRAEELCVMFLQDLRDVQARLRQEKLAAMGRVSTGIAHEIRNPLAAIAQANALMAEDATSASQYQLTHMVAANVERLKRIVDDVMEVASGQHPPATVIESQVLVEAVCREWAATAGVATGPQGLLHIDLPEEPLGVVFDAEHLRRVLVNLLDNACRHGTRGPGSIEVRLLPDGAGRAELCVASDGEPIPSDVEAHLFEPFFSTRSRGTGLGLYICKEVCERYGVSIDYRLRDPQHRTRNEFFLVLRCQALASSSFRSTCSP